MSEKFDLYFNRGELGLPSQFTGNEEGSKYLLKKKAAKLNLNCQLTTKVGTFSWIILRKGCVGNGDNSKVFHASIGPYRVNGVWHHKPVLEIASMVGNVYTQQAEIALGAFATDDKDYIVAPPVYDSVNDRFIALVTTAGMLHMFIVNPADGTFVQKDFSTGTETYIPRSTQYNENAGAGYLMAKADHGILMFNLGDLSAPTLTEKNWGTDVRAIIAVSGDKFAITTDSQTDNTKFQVRIISGSDVSTSISFNEYTYPAGNVRLGNQAIQEGLYNTTEDTIILAGRANRATENYRQRAMMIAVELVGNTKAGEIELSGPRNGHLVSTDGATIYSLDTYAGNNPRNRKLTYAAGTFTLVSEVDQQGFKPFLQYFSKYVIIGNTIIASSDDSVWIYFYDIDTLLRDPAFSQDDNMFFSAAVIPHTMNAIYPAMYIPNEDSDEEPVTLSVLVSNFQGGKYDGSVPNKNYLINIKNAEEIEGKGKQNFYKTLGSYEIDGADSSCILEAPGTLYTFSSQDD